MAEDYIQETNLKDVYIIRRPVLADERGFFREVFRKNELENRLGFELDFVQVNQSHSQLGTLRGIHRAPWHKLVMVTAGKAQQVVVDLREQSETFGKHISIELDQELAMFIPAFCGNAFLALSSEVDYMYNVTDYWYAGAEKSIIYNDTDIGIQWQLANVRLSEKDLQSLNLRQTFPQKF